MLVQVIVFHVLCIKPLPQEMRPYEKNSVNMETKYINIHENVYYNVVSKMVPYNRDMSWEGTLI